MSFYGVRLLACCQCFKSCYIMMLPLIHQANLQSRDNVGRTSLHLAAQADSISSISYLLLECGVDVNERTTYTDDTSLHVAAKVNVLHKV